MDEPSVGRGAVQLLQQIVSRIAASAVVEHVVGAVEVFAPKLHDGEILLVFHGVRQSQFDEHDLAFVLTSLGVPGRQGVMGVPLRKCVEGDGFGFAGDDLDAVRIVYIVEFA